jgi:hypothetical protein
MSTNKRNTIILTTIEGERGADGTTGAAGHPVQHGTGDPNTISTLLYPDYSLDPFAGGQRGAEEIIFQDTVTGDIWRYQYLNGLPTTGVWELIDNNRGLPGPPGDPALDKLDISFTDSSVRAPYQKAYGRYRFNKIGKSKVTLGSFHFPGTADIPALAAATTQVVVHESGHVLQYQILDEDDNVIGTVLGSKARQPRILTFNITGSWPVEAQECRIVFNVADYGYYKDNRKRWETRACYGYLYSFIMYNV